MHRESPPPQTEQPQPAPPDDIHRKQSRKITWRNPNYYSPKNDTTSSNQGGMSKSTSDQSTSQRALAHSGRKRGHTKLEITIASSESDSDIKAQPEALSAVIDESEKTSIPKAQPKQCKYWVTGNCVHGDKCKDLHSWFCGSGFTMLAKLLLEFLFYLDMTSYIQVARMHLFELGTATVARPNAVCRLPNAVKAWNLQNQSEFSLNPPAGLVCCMAVDDDRLFAGMEDGTILVWKWNPDANIPELVATLMGHDGSICSLVIGAGRLYSDPRDCTIKAWDLQNLQCVYTLSRHTKAVMSVICWDCYLLSASLDNTLKVWAAAERGTIEVVYEFKEDCGLIALCGMHDREGVPIYYAHAVTILSASTTCPHLWRGARFFPREKLIQ